MREELHIERTLKRNIDVAVDYERKCENLNTSRTTKLRKIVYSGRASNKLLRTTLSICVISCLKIWLIAVTSNASLLCSFTASDDQWPILKDNQPVSRCRRAIWTTFYVHRISTTFSFCWPFCFVKPRCKRFFETPWLHLISFRSTLHVRLTCSVYFFSYCFPYINFHILHFCRDTAEGARYSQLVVGFMP